jgi:hypothetical protein
LLNLDRAQEARAAFEAAQVLAPGARAIAHWPCEVRARAQRP